MSCHIREATRYARLALPLSPSLVCFVSGAALAALLAVSLLSLSLLCALLALYAVFAAVEQFLSINLRGVVVVVACTLVEIAFAVVVVVAVDVVYGIHINSQTHSHAHTVESIYFIFIQFERHCAAVDVDVDVINLLCARLCCCLLWLCDCFFVVAHLNYAAYIAYIVYRLSLSVHALPYGQFSPLRFHWQFPIGNISLPLLSFPLALSLPLSLFTFLI